MQKIIFSLACFGFMFLGCAHQSEVRSPETASLSNEPMEVSQISENKSDFASEEVHKRLLVIAANRENEKKPQKNSKEFLINLPIDKPESNQKQEWHSSYINVFYKSPDKVDQIAITTINCKASKDIIHKRDIQARLTQQVKQVSEKVFGVPFVLSGERYFKELGPHWDRHVQVSITESYPGTTAMRISRGIYKCDGHGGYGLRYDFFLN